MQLTTLITLLIIAIILTTNIASNVPDIIQQINRKSQLNLNILINFERTTNNTEKYEQFVKTSQLDEIPKIIITEKNYKVTALNKNFGDQMLTVAWITDKNWSNTLKTVDQLLWQLHYKDIFLIYQGLLSTFYNIFQNCWNYGFISVLLYHNNQLYSYHPYPRIKVVTLNDVQQFYDKTHLQNFFGYEMVVPVVEFPPVCFSYTNTKGELKRVGYLYNWIEIFLRHHNASIKHYSLNIWQPNISFAYAQKILYEINFSFVPMVVHRTKNYSSSVVLTVTKTALIVPSNVEISSNLYIFKTFSKLLWLIILICVALFLTLMISVNIIFHQKLNFCEAFLNTISIILFLSITLRRGHNLFNFYLYLIFLVYGLFFSNLFDSSLFSLITSKVYEPELHQLEDLNRNKLLIWKHSADTEDFLNMRIPEFVKQRLHTGNNTVLRIKREELDPSYIYTGQEYLVDYILSQQRFMKRPKMKRLDQPISYKPLFVTVSHRSPVIDQFNRYLFYIRENGIMLKIFRDTEWHGIYSGSLRIRFDDEVLRAMTIEYFEYAFLIWICGLLCAFMWFLIEYFHRNILNLMLNIVNKIVK
ncbi:uncharacterized protein LOC119604922 [Lucilia sericata]|uniref:uncharacterized protein LOC119604922 n=1 Tax=Lucilia sericata TaxID=13632 RepID=UPI0018A874B9|nr:uncharacterized protein LOC119604922 [Lucilia sericata]